MPDDLEKKQTDYFETLIRVIDSDDDVITFLHNTKMRETAERVLDSGFEFQSHIDYTTDVVSGKDPVTIKYFTIVRQSYGQYTLIIQISKELIVNYSQLLIGKDCHFSELLTINPPYEGPEGERVFCLPPQFVKGYVNAETGEFISNKNFNAMINLPIFETNLNNLNR